MALQFMDGFDHYYLTGDAGFTGAAAATGQKWDAQFSNGEMYPELGSGRFGGMAMRVRASGGGGSITKDIPTPSDELIVGFAWLPSAGATADNRITFTNSLGALVNLQLEHLTGIITVDRAGTPLATSTVSVLNNGVWQYIEFRLKEHDTLGEVEVKLNESVVISATGLNTGAAGGLLTNVTIVATSNLQLNYVDDLYLLDTTGATNNTFLGDSRISALPTFSDGDSNDFTLFDDGTQSYSPIGVNSEAVRNEGDLTIGRDHNYVESGLIGAREDYNNVAFTEAPITIHGVQVVNNSKKTSTGVLKYRDEMTISGTQYDNGTDVIASTGDYHMSTYIRDTDPSDNAAWTVSKVNAVGSGFSITVREI